VRMQEMVFKLLGRNPVLTRYRLVSSQRPIIYDNSKLVRIGWKPVVRLGEAVTRLVESEKSRS
jgi:hypothetical protein